MNKNILITVVIVLLAGGISFYGGMKFQQSKNTNLRTNNNFQGGMRQGGNGQRMGGRATTGEVISSDKNSITVKLQDGSSKIVILSDKTTINKATEGSVNDLSTGTKVMVFGTDNTDGSVTAQNVQINPQFGLRGNPNDNRTNPQPSGQMGTSSNNPSSK
jgi:hypothetical protein